MNYMTIGVIILSLIIGGCISSPTTTHPTTVSKPNKMVHKATPTETKSTFPCRGKKLMEMDYITKTQIDLKLYNMTHFNAANNKILHYNNWKKYILDRISGRKEYLGECYRYSEFRVEAEKILVQIAKLDSIANEKWNASMAAEQKKQKKDLQRKKSIQALNSGKYSSVYRDKNIEAKVVDIYTYEEKRIDSFTKMMEASQGFSNLDPTCIEIDVTVINPGKIVYPKNAEIFGYEDGSDIGGRKPVDFFIEDNYGNRFLPAIVSPEYFGMYSTDKSGLRPGETKRFVIKFNGRLLESTHDFQIFFPTGSLGNGKEFTLLLPYSILK